MAKDWTQYSALYPQIFADCIPVRGAFNSAFYDLTRHEIIIFPTDYYPYLQDLGGRRIGEILDKAESEPHRQQATSFLDFLDDNEIIMLSDNMVEFPPIDPSWDYPGLVQNAIIDVSGAIHDFAKIFHELSELACQHVQIRCFSSLLTLNKCHLLLQQAEHKSIAGVELILKHEQGIVDDEYARFLNRHPLVTAITIHSATQAKYVVANPLISMHNDAPPRRVRFTTQVIGSERHCGLITQQQLTPPSVTTFFEAKSFNGCLNRKISVDVNGKIKKCPSMIEVYGDVRSTSLIEAVQHINLKDSWNISKDNIAICSECEYRYACSDCRAYLENPGDSYSKPLKCGYDPYRGVWNEWGGLDKLGAAKLYGIDVVTSRQGNSDVNVECGREDAS